jgi:hypothetical protein
MRVKHCYRWWKIGMKMQGPGLEPGLNKRVINLVGNHAKPNPRVEQATKLETNHAKTHTKGQTKGLSKHQSIQGPALNQAGATLRSKPKVWPTIKLLIKIEK